MSEPTSGQEPESADPAESTPRRVGPYRLEERLGSGGMGEVYRAWDERLERHVAIKHLHLRHAADPKVLSRLHREAKALANVDHEAVVQIYDLLETPEGEWVVMELVRGETLRDWLEREGPLPWRRAATVAREISAGLAMAHEKGVVHRDLKSENVMVTPEGRVKILDFGLAKRLSTQEVDESALTQHGEILGTVRSMSPEQARGEEIDSRSDLFSLGSLLYEMLSGKSPFRGRSLLQTLSLICHEPHLPVSELRAEIPAELCRLVDELLAKIPGQRPSGATEVEERLAPFAEPREASATAPRPTRGSRLPKARIQEAWSQSSETAAGPPPTLHHEVTPPDRPWKPLSDTEPLGSTSEALEAAAEPWGSRWSFPARYSALWRWAAPAALLSLILIGVLVFETRREPTGTSTEMPRVAVLGFANLSGDPAVDWLGAALTESFLGELLAMRLDLVSGESVARMKEELTLSTLDTLAPDTAARVGARLAASHLVVGSYLALDDNGGRRLRVQVEVQRTRDGDVVGAARSTGRETELGTLTAQLGRDLQSTFADRVATGGG